MDHGKGRGERVGVSCRARPAVCKLLNKQTNEWSILVSLSCEPTAVDVRQLSSELAWSVRQVSLGTNLKKSYSHFSLTVSCIFLFFERIYQHLCGSQAPLAPLPDFVSFIASSRHFDSSHKWPMSGLQLHSIYILVPAHSHINIASVLFPSILLPSIQRFDLVPGKTGYLLTYLLTSSFACMLAKGFHSGNVIPYSPRFSWQFAWWRAENKARKTKSNSNYICIIYI